MFIKFFLKVSEPFFKDQWGYKVSSPIPGTRVGTITTFCNFMELPKSQEQYSEDERLLQDLLNGRPVSVCVNATLEGCVTKKIFDVPGALALAISGNYIKVRTRLLDFKECGHGFWKSNSGEATCELQIINDLEEQAPTNGAPVIINPVPLHRFHLPCKNPLGGLRHLLNNPGKYYVSEFGFFIERPQCLEDYIRIYKYECGDSAPNPEEILLDPLLYANHENTCAANFARRIISGEFAG